EMDGSLFNWTYGGDRGEPDASSTLRSGQLRNFSRYKSARMDELLAQGVREVDPGKRKRIYAEVQALFAEDVPFIYVMYWHWYDVFSSRIKGLPSTVLQGANPLYAKAYTWWIE
ncbi:MAG: hypothetical protein HY660_12380, partial [Armatimonadetes bacterium]|nr:hypothetical protein [Armatimonadota bacterium]